MNIKSTIVYQKNWNVIHEKCPECGYLKTPNPKCDWCGGSGRKYRYIINEGSSRSSKTRSLCQIFWSYAGSNSNKRLSVWRNVKKDCKDTVGHDMRQIYPFISGYDYKCYNKTEGIYTLQSSSTIEIRGTDDEEQVMGFNGHVSWLNEPYKISKDTFDQLDQRAEDFIVIDWNPKKAHWIDDLKKNRRTIVIKSTFRDNPFCPAEQRIKILSYQPLSMCSVVESDIMTEATAREYDVIQNTLYLSTKQIKELSRCRDNEINKSANKYKWCVYGLGVKAEKPNRIFFWEKIPIHVYQALDCQIFYGVDWGTVDPWGILEAKYYDGALYFRQLNYKSENEIRQGLSQQELDAINRKNDEEGGETGIVLWLFEKLGISKKCYTICDTNRPLKIRALVEAGYDYAIAAPKPPGSIIDGIDILNDLRVYYTDDSLEIEYEQENYERKVDRFGTVLDEPEDKDNHLMDPARYIALFLTLQEIIKKK